MDMLLRLATNWTTVEQLIRLQSLRSDGPKAMEISHYFNDILPFLNGTSIFLMTSRLPIYKKISMFARIRRISHDNI